MPITHMLIQAQGFIPSNGIFTDNFTDGEVAPQWTKQSDNAVEESGKLRVYVNQNGNQDGYKLNFNAEGDFDVNVVAELTGYSITNFDDRGYTKLGFKIDGYTHLIQFGDIGSENRAYTNTNDPAYSINSNNIIIPGAGCTLRLKRVGTTLTYDVFDGGIWNNVATITVSTNPISDIFLDGSTNIASPNGSLYHQFDDFSLTADSFVAP